MTPTLRARIDSLIRCYHESDEPLRDVALELQAGLRERGFFRCYSCDNWYADEEHYRGGCCLACGNPCDGSWPDGAPPGWPETAAAHRAELACDGAGRQEGEGA